MFGGDEALRVVEFDPPQRDPDGLVIDHESQDADVCKHQSRTSGNSLCWRLRPPGGKSRSTPASSGRSAGCSRAGTFDSAGSVADSQPSARAVPGFA